MNTKIPLVLSLVWAVFCLACSGNTQAPDSGIDTADANITHDCGPACEDDNEGRDGDEGDSQNLWQEVDKELTAAFDSGKIKGDFVILDVFDDSGKLVHSISLGQAPGRDEPIAIASASKWVSSTVFLALVQDGKLSLDDTTGQVLGWTEPDIKDITLRHLLSFTSGLQGDDCVKKVLTSPEECLELIHGAGLEQGAMVGKTFHYGPQHMAVAAAMAKKVTGKSWRELFTEKVVLPSRFTSDAIYYTAPKQKVGIKNPLISGGLTISINDYERFLSALQGIGDSTLLSVDLFTEQHSEQWPTDINVVYTPNPDIHYALGCWRECSSPDDVAACDADLMVHSAGAFGFVPFMDLTNGSYGVLAAEGDSGAGRSNLEVLNQLRPMIAEAMQP